MHADDHQAAVLIFAVPGVTYGGSQAIDAGVGPEIHEDHIAVKRSGFKGGELIHAIAPHRSGIVCGTGRLAAGRHHHHRRLVSLFMA